MSLETTPFNIAEHLNTSKEIQEFLREVAKTGDESDFLHALNTAARAKGMTKVAKEIGVTRSSLYRSLAKSGNPRFSTIYKVTKALGVKLAVV